MKQPQELKPEFECKLQEHGNGAAFRVPSSFYKLWDLKKGNRYRVMIIEELEKGLEYSLDILLAWRFKHGG